MDGCSPPELDSLLHGDRPSSSIRVSVGGWAAKPMEVRNLPDVCEAEPRALREAWRPLAARRHLDVQLVQV